MAISKDFIRVGESKVFLGGENPAGTPNYPVAKMGDFGLVIETSAHNPKNPRQFVDSGTRGHMATNNADTTTQDHCV